MEVAVKSATPHFPALRSDPMALSGASRRKKILVAMKKLLILLALLLPATLTAAEIRVRLTAATTAASRAERHGAIAGVCTGGS